MTSRATSNKGTLATHIATHGTPSNTHSNTHSNTPSNTHRVYTLWDNKRLFLTQRDHMTLTWLVIIHPVHPRECWLGARASPLGALVCTYHHHKLVTYVISPYQIRQRRWGSILHPVWLKYVGWGPGVWGATQSQTGHPLCQNSLPLVRKEAIYSVWCNV